jgi:hypothetical protein
VLRAAFFAIFFAALAGAFFAAFFAVRVLPEASRPFPGAGGNGEPAADAESRVGSLIIVCWKGNARQATLSTISSAISKLAWIFWVSSYWSRAS